MFYEGDTFLICAVFYSGHMEGVRLFGLQLLFLKISITISFTHYFTPGSVALYMKRA